MAPRLALPTLAVLTGVAVLAAPGGGARDATRGAAKVELAGVGGAPMAFAGPTGRRALSGPWHVHATAVAAPFALGARRLTKPSFEGSVASFRTRFSLPVSGDYAIRFESVNHRAQVWLDGRLVPRGRRRRDRPLARRLHAAFGGRVLVVSEFGAEGDGRNPAGAPGGLAFQARLVARHIRAYRADPRLSGLVVWALRDFAMRPNFLGGSVRAHAPGIVLRRGLNQKGLFTYEDRAKPAAAVVARLFAATARAGASSQ